MPGELHELSVAIGGLEARMEMLTQTVRENQEKSTAEHREVHTIVTAMAESVRIVAAKVDRMEPLTEDYQEKRAQGRGAAKVLHLLYAVGGGSAVLIGTKILEWASVKHP